MSSLSLEKNGRVASSKRTKHIKAKYFLIKDYYNSGEIDLCYCPTDVMWADISTKPLQGQKFRDMHAFLQNCSWDYNNDVELQTDTLAQRLMNQQVKTVASPWECVGELANLTREKMRKRRQSPTCVSRAPCRKWSFQISRWWSKCYSDAPDITVMFKILQWCSGYYSDVQNITVMLRILQWCSGYYWCRK